MTAVNWGGAPHGVKLRMTVKHVQRLIDDPELAVVGFSIGQCRDQMRDFACAHVEVIGALIEWDATDEMDRGIIDGFQASAPRYLSGGTTLRPDFPELVARECCELAH
ncbi:hypothetical protein, partial [Mycolicibacterium moriokaense]|uniref:hypothetical protein n=1 Tax=Mycolicibacterium moriokaense TaxID=39691 RepID=UPI001C649BB6